MKWLSNLIYRLRPKKKYQYEFVEDLPDRFEDFKVYIIGTKQNPWQVGFKCPCGCQDIIQLYTNPQAETRWDIFLGEKGTVTLHPSVWRTHGCQSHFFLRKGRTIWCPDWQNRDAWLSEKRHTSGMSGK